MEQITLTGMVLLTTPIGEYDKRVVLLTKERGKIAAFARGARRPNNPLSGATEPFSFGSFSLYEGRTSYTMVSASISNYFAELRMDVEGACYGFYFMDIANYYAREANDETELLKLLYQTLRALAKKSIPDRLIRYIYELKAITINGEGPDVFHCVICRKSTEGSFFSPLKGGLVCDGCRPHSVDCLPMDPSTLYALQYIETSSIEKLYTFAVSEKVLGELGAIMKRYMEIYVDRHFKSLDILEQMIGA